MKKLVVRLEIYDDKAKQKALKAVSTLQGIDSIAVDMTEKKLTVIGTVDPVDVVSKLRKRWQTDIISVGHAKEPEKKEEPKPEGEQAKKEDAAGKDQEQVDPNKKPGEGAAGEEQGKPAAGDNPEKQSSGEQQPNGEGEDGNKDQKIRIDPVALEMVRAYRAYNPQLMSYYYNVQSIDENPDACSIC